MDLLADKYRIWPTYLRSERVAVFPKRGHGQAGRCVPVQRAWWVREVQVLDHRHHIGSTVDIPEVPRHGHVAVVLLFRLRNENS